eukprot:m.27114 g.27114  ORF g.27114 m.27114 type:complete len:288 (+) comp29798_c0_seq1:8-871(+)
MPHYVSPALVLLRVLTENRHPSAVSPGTRTAARNGRTTTMGINEREEELGKQLENFWPGAGLNRLQPNLSCSYRTGRQPGLYRINVSHAEAEQNEQRKPSSLSLIPDRGTFQEDVCSECSQRLVQMTKFCLPYGFKINIMNTPATKVKYLIDIDSYEADSDDPSSCLNSSLVEADHKSCKVHLMQIVFSKKMKQKEAKCTCPNLATKRELEKSDIRLYIASDWRSELYDDDSGHKGRRGNRSQISLAKELNRLVRKILTLLCPKPSKPIYTKLHNFRERIPKETITN